jgi:hypothetical protein
LRKKLSGYFEEYNSQKGETWSVVKSALIFCTIILKDY